MITAGGTPLQARDVIIAGTAGIWLEAWFVSGGAYDPVFKAPAAL